jgi:hypothetical protein
VLSLLLPAELSPAPVVALPGPPLLLEPVASLPEGRSPVLPVAPGSVPS